LEEAACAIGYDVANDAVGSSLEGTSHGHHRHRFAAAPLMVEAVEAIDAGQHIVVGLCGPGFNGTPGDLDTVGQIYSVFTLSDGKIIRWRDYLTREQALAFAGASDPHWQ
jgi:hypothetical protein